MRSSTHIPLDKPVKSMGGFIGGEARLLKDHIDSGKSISGSILSRAVMYSLAVLEVNATMGLIVAAPTAGSSGIVPGLLLSLQEEYGLSDSILAAGLLTASAVGYIVMRNGSVSGAEAGCQAEVGTASAMAAAAVVEMKGGKPEQVLNAASFAFMNLLGLVCDPVGGLVECPCQSRNTVGTSNALVCADLSLSGIKSVIGFDSMVETMLRVGRSIPPTLRETGRGGCAMACRE